MNAPHPRALAGRDRTRRVLAACLAGALALPPAAAQAPAPTPASSRSRAPVTVNFVNADIEAVTRAFAVMIDRNILVDPRVKGAITVYSEQPQSINQAWQNYLAALRGLGFAVVDSGGLLKVVPEADAKLQTTTVTIGEARGAVRGDQIITQIFPLRYENPNSLVAVLRPLISANNTINANPGNNSLVITDYAENLKRIERMIAALDQPSGTDVEVIPLQHAVAADLAPLVQRLTDSGGALLPGQPTIGGAVAVLVDARSNSLLVRAPNAARLASVRATIARLDRPSSNIGPGGGLWVVHLKNADAVKLATVIRAAFGGGGGSSGAGSTPSTSPTPSLANLGQATQGAGTSSAGLGGAPSLTGGASSSQPSTGGFIQADPSTNSLIITAAEPLYRQVRAMIDQLDSRRAQVYIESMIVEVSGGDAVDFGFQWQGVLGRNGNESVQAVQNLPSGGNSNIIGINTGLAQGTINLGDGLNLGLVRAVNGVTSLSAILRLLQSRTNTNIVSTPNLITLDNEEAKIVVGQNVPFITGQFTQTATAATNPFQTIERKDVGITLRIKPQIGEGGAIRMTIFQEQSAVLAATAAGTTNAGPSTTKRSIESTVTVDDGAILVLGGLIEDNVTVTQNKVPLLGDIPLLGALFRSESRERKRTNLMVFLRPIVMRDAESSNKFSIDRYDQLRGQQLQAQPTPSIVLPVNEAPLLPALPPPAPAASAPPPNAPSPGGAPVQPKAPS